MSAWKEKTNRFCITTVSGQWQEGFSPGIWLDIVSGQLSMVRCKNA
jgi:hypothetical protein